MLRCLKTLFITLFALSQVMPSYRTALAASADAPQGASEASFSTLQLAQFERGGYQRPSLGGSEAGPVDLEPPLIEHDVIGEAEADIRQTFVATVVDDQELDSVLFYYRFAGETSYSRYVMMPLSFSSTYIAQIPTDPDNVDAIEYYIQARDASGNRTVRGYTFSPLVRNLIPPAVEVPIAATEQAATEAAVEESGSRFPKVVYIVGGVLLLGLIAGAAGSSGGGSDSGGSDCDTAGCRLSLTVDQPF